MEGYFAEDSIAWRVLSARQSSLFIAQITNLLEVPHIDFQSVLMGHDPLFPTNGKRQRGIDKDSRKSRYARERFSRTVSVPLPIVFEDKAAADKCARHLHRYHRPMHGEGADGHPAYSATDPESMLFAAVTISHAALNAYEQLGPDDGILPRRLPDAERDRYFDEMATLAVLMGVPEDDVPRSSAQVAAYYRSIGDRFRYRPDWTAAQLRTLLPLLVPTGWTDLRATASDLGLISSIVLALAVLPAPSRRLNRIPAIADPMLKLVHFAALPALVLLRSDRINRVVQSWFLGEEQAQYLDRIRHRVRAAPGRAAVAVR